MTPTIANIYDQQGIFFNSGSKITIAKRKKALKKLRQLIVAREEDICQALYSDFKKPKFESLLSETQFVLAELNHFIENLSFWAGQKRVRGSMGSFPSREWIQYEPYGRVLVISPWNYPFMLAISPLIGAVAAGNTVVLKPSEMSTATSKILRELVGEAFDTEWVSVVEGGVATSQELLALKWDYIFFTGSTRVGKIVYKSAAEHLTPVTLELGGKNPCIVDPTAALKVTARRIVWGKLLNAGQTCLAPDYLLVHHAIKDRLVAEIIKSITAFYGENIEVSKDYARIATPGQYKRLKEMIAEAEVLFGGACNDEDHYIEPTLLEAPPMDSIAMKEEIFGPVLPIYTYQEESELEGFIHQFGRPLSLYVFSKRKQFQKKVFATYSFGGGTINDTILHIANKRMPFGGVGDSGFGGYHGEYSFQLFSHKKAIVKKPFLIDVPLRYPPYHLPDWLAKRLKHFL